MLTVVLERTFCSSVGTLSVGQEVGIGAHMRNDRPVSQNLSFNSFNLLSQAEVNNLVDVVRLSARVHGQMVCRACPWNSGFVAFFRNKAFTLTPGEYSVCIATFAAIACVVAIDYLVGG